jgi:hypothetical protein
MRQIMALDHRPEPIAIKQPEAHRSQLFLCRLNRREQPIERRSLQFFELVGRQPDLAQDGIGKLCRPLCSVMRMPAPLITMAR